MRENEVTMIVCGRAPRAKPCSCGAPSTKLCDYPLRGAKAGKTCDAPICGRCATSIGEDRDLCPPHARIWNGEKAEPPGRLTDDEIAGIEF